VFLVKKDKKEVKDTSSKTKKQKEAKEKDVTEHVVEVDTMESIEQSDNELNDRINRLYGFSSNTTKETKQYDPKELEDIRKKLILLLIGIIIFGVVTIVILVNPFKLKSTKGPSESAVDKESSTNNKKDDVPLGELDIDHSLVLRLNEKISFTANDFMKIDLFELYRPDSLEMNNLSNNAKLYLLKRDNAFYNFISNEKMDEYVKTCDANGLEISKDDFDSAVKKVFGPNITIDYAPINYSYYTEDYNSTKVTLTYENEKFILRCNEFMDNIELTKFVQQNLEKAVKTENAVELYQRVVFVNQTGVYQDPDFTILITNDHNAKLTDYIANGALYKYTFNQEQENYYLSKLEKVIETAS
jgi:hypothetical protein